MSSVAGAAKRHSMLSHKMQRGWRVQLQGWQQHELASARRYVNDVIHASLVACETSEDTYEDGDVNWLDVKHQNNLAIARIKKTSPLQSQQSRKNLSQRMTATACFQSWLYR